MASVPWDFPPVHLGMAAPSSSPTAHLCVLNIAWHSVSSSKQETWIVGGRGGGLSSCSGIRLCWPGYSHSLDPCPQNYHDTLSDTQTRWKRKVIHPQGLWKQSLMNWRDGSEAKDTGCSGRKPEFSSQHLIYESCLLPYSPQRHQPRSESTLVLKCWSLQSPG